MTSTAKKDLSMTRRPGRPTKYDKAYGDNLALTLKVHFTGSDTLEAVCKKLKFSKVTFFKLCSLSPTLNQAYQNRNVATVSKGGLTAIYDKRFADELAPDLPALFSQGESLVQVCKKLDIAKSTFQKLCSLSPAFKAAYAAGRDSSEAWWTTIGQLGATGKVKVNAAVWKFNMVNRFNWADRVETSGTLEIGKTEFTRIAMPPPSDATKD